MNQHDKVFDEWVRSLEDDGYVEPSNFIADPIPWPKRPPELEDWILSLPVTKSTSKTEVQWPRPTGTEKDPSGKALNTPGAKADAGKNRVWLMIEGFSRALEKVAEVTTIGANKYTENGWLNVSDAKKRYMNALSRHLLKYAQGNLYDDEHGGIGTPHLSQVCWNALAVLELELREEKYLSQKDMK